MSYSNKNLRKLVPRRLRKLFAPGLHYSQRLGRWIIILAQIRGETRLDQAKLFASALAAPITALRTLLSWQDPVLLFDATVDVRGVGRFKVRKHTDDLWHVLPWREREIHKLLHQRLKPGGVFVDAGANIGVYSVLAGRLVGPAGKVVAVEMIPQTAAILRQHIRLNGLDNITVVERALSDRAGERVTAVLPPGKCGQASIAPTCTNTRGVEVDVHTITVDQVVAGLEHIDLIKIDLEGAELPALIGAREGLRRTSAIIFEAHSSETTTAELESRGFVVGRITDKDRLGQHLHG